MIRFGNGKFETSELLASSSPFVHLPTSVTMPRKTSLQQESETVPAITHAKVIVIGGGIAGLSAVEYLLSNGMNDFLLLEAANRYGGRMHTVHFGSSEAALEIGANWIKGAHPSNCAYNLACRHRLLPEKQQYLDRKLSTYHFSDGTILEPAIGNNLYQSLKKMLGEPPINSYYQDKTKLSLKQHLDKGVKEFLRKNPKVNNKSTQSVFNYFENYMMMKCGDDLNSIGADSTYFQPRIPGGNIKIQAGFGTLIRSMVARWPSERLLVNQSVVSIDWSGNLIEVRCVNGLCFTSEAVIVTFSLGVLKKNHRKIFVPPLPERKADVIDRMGFGHLCKIFLEFETPFWQSGKFGTLNLCWSEQEIMDSDWTTSLLGFEEVLSNPKVICGWLCGPRVLEIEKNSDDQIAKDCIRVLRQFLGDPSLPSPKKAICSRWSSDKNVLGSHAYPTMNTKPVDSDVLAEPLPSKKPRLFFAGEATHSLYMGTLHGARATGLREAQRYMSLYPKNGLIVNGSSETSLIFKPPSLPNIKLV